MVTTLNPWLVRYPIVTVLEERQEPIHVGLPQVYYRPLAGTIDRQSLCAELLSIVIEALALHTWTRLKACLDCQWVFYDRSKNTSKLWCGMLAEGPLGRSCGSIAKVRRWRERQKGLK
jgi:predicted RNA-binding Zn ribbon-like protein